MMGNAGNMASMAIAWVDIIAATNTTNSVNPIGVTPPFIGIDSSLLLASDAGRHGHDGCEVGKIRRYYQRGPSLRELAELLHVLFADAQLHGFDAAAVGQCDAHLAQPLGRGARHGENGLRLTLGFVDLLLFVRLGLLYHALLVAFRRVDLGITLSFGGQHHGALFALRAHLLLHGLQHVLGRRDVLDLVAQNFDPPRSRRLVQFTHDVGIDGAARLEGAVEFDLADLAAQRGLRQLRNGEPEIGDAVRGEMRIHHLHVEHRIDAHLDVVAGDADLLGDIDRDFLETMPVRDLLDEWNEDMEAGLEGAAVLAQVLDHECTLLRHHRRGLRHDDDDDNRNRNSSVAQGNFQEHLLVNEAPTNYASPCTISVSPSTRSMRARLPASMIDRPELIALQELPRNSMRMVSPGGSAAGNITVSPAGPLFMIGRLRRMRS